MRKDSLKYKIVMATISLGSTKEIASVSIKDIAKKCKISPSAIYYHFENKYELVFETIFYIVKELSAVIENTLDDNATFKENYTNAMKASALYHLNNEKISLFYNRMLIVPNAELKRAEHIKIVDYCPMHKLLFKAIDDKIIINTRSIITLAYYPLCNFIIHNFLTNEPTHISEIDIIINCLYNAISNTEQKPIADIDINKACIA